MRKNNEESPQKSKNKHGQVNARPSVSLCNRTVNDCVASSYTTTVGVKSTSCRAKNTHSHLAFDRCICHSILCVAHPQEVTLAASLLQELATRTTSLLTEGCNKPADVELKKKHTQRKPSRVRRTCKSSLCGMRNTFPANSRRRSGTSSFRLKKGSVCTIWKQNEAPHGEDGVNDRGGGGRGGTTGGHLAAKSTY